MRKAHGLTASNSNGDIYVLPLPPYKTLHVIKITHPSYMEDTMSLQSGKSSIESRDYTSSLFDWPLRYVCY